MTIVEYFSCYTSLPIKINHITAHVKEHGFIDEVIFYPVDMNVERARGVCRRYIKHDGLYREPIRCADIGYALSMDIPWRRLVQAKELVHLTDNGQASTKEQVQRLIEEIVLPPGISSSLPGHEDHFGDLKALMVLLPRDSLDLLKPKVDAGLLSTEEVANVARIPVAYARLALSNFWPEVQDVFSS